jgi:2-oxoglutarate decarboxylase
VRGEQYDRGSAVDARVVLPPPAPPGLCATATTAHRVHAQGDAAILDDNRVPDKAAVKRVLITSGKIYYDIIAELDKRDEKSIAVVRMEQYYPLPIQEINAALGQYPNADLVWTQDEPENQGAWPFICLELAKHLNGRTIAVASRPASASPATGSSKRSAQEQVNLIERALTLP